MMDGAGPIERAMAARDVPSPCISICRVGPDGFCEGCLRTLDEVAAWSRMSDEDKRRVWRAIELRAHAGFLAGGHP
jgi:predicted Fe-S protein YdhL (DUF1289 family)